MTNPRTDLTFPQRARALWTRSSRLATAVLVPTGIAGAGLLGYGVHLFAPGHGLRLAWALLIGVVVGWMPYGVIRELRESETGKLDPSDWLRILVLGLFVSGSAMTKLLERVPHGGGFIVAGAALLVGAGAVFVGLPGIAEARAARAALRERVLALADKRAAEAPSGGEERRRL